MSWPLLFFILACIALLLLLYYFQKNRDKTGTVWDASTNALIRAIFYAHNASRHEKRAQVELEHLLIGLATDEHDQAARHLAQYGITASRCTECLATLPAKHRSSNPGEGKLTLSMAGKAVLSDTVMLAQHQSQTAHNRLVIDTPHLLSSLLAPDTSKKTLYRLLRKMGVDIRSLLDSITE